MLADWKRFLWRIVSPSKNSALSKHFFIQQIWEVSLTLVVMIIMTAQNLAGNKFFVGRCPADTYWPEPIIPELPVLLNRRIPFSLYPFALKIFFNIFKPVKKIVLNCYILCSKLYKIFCMQFLLLNLENGWPWR